MNCQGCGRRLEILFGRPARRCTYCGYEQPAEVAPRPPELAAHGTAPRARSGRPHVLLLVLGLVVVAPILMVIAGVFLWLRSQAPAQAREAPPERRSPTATEPPPKLRYFESDEDAASIGRALARALPDGRVRSITVHAGAATATAIAKKKGKNLRCTLRGDDPGCTPAFGTGTFSDAIPIAEIDTAILPSLAAMARSTLGESSEVTEMWLSRSPFPPRAPRWAVYTRAHGMMRCDLEGNLLEASDQNGKTIRVHTVDFLTEPTEVARLLREQLGDGVELTELILRRERANVEVRDPETPDHVDAYRVFEGQVQRSRPVELWPRQRANVAGCVVRLDSVDLRLTPRLVADALERVAIEGGEVSQVMLTNNKCSNERFSWRVFVQSERRHGSVQYALDGTLLRVFQ